MSSLFLFDWLYVIGTVSFSISGYLIGARKQYDLLGVMILTLLTAIGGGMIRDVLVDRMPVVFTSNQSLYFIFGTLALAWLFKLHHKNSTSLHKLFIIADSVGLVAFSIAGAQVGIDMHLNLFGVCFLGFVTAIGGGLVRDMMVNDVPFILHKDFYGTVSILVAGLLYTLDLAGYSGPLVSWPLFAFGLFLRLIAHARDLSLPRVEE
jgi:uncharacterized membrane protein YeiH